MKSVYEVAAIIGFLLWLGWIITELEEFHREVQSLNMGRLARGILFVFTSVIGFVLIGLAAVTLVYVGVQIS